jgi:hypothetical protein
MKMSLSADELSEFEGMSDADLTKAIRDSLATFRAKRAEAEDDLEQADPSTAGHGGRSTSTLETTASQRAGTLQATQDSAQRLREYGLSERRITEILNPSSVSESDRIAADKLVKGYNRL